jgi:hypothetical protein
MISGSISLDLSRKKKKLNFQFAFGILKTLRNGLEGFIDLLVNKHLS